MGAAAPLGADPAPAPRGRRLLQGVVGGLAGAGFGAAVDVAFLALVRRGALPLPALTRPQWVVVLAALPALAWLHVALHEAGHLAAGRLAGLRPTIFVVGPFRWERAADGRWQLRGAGWRGLFGGFAQCVPAGPLDGPGALDRVRHAFRVLVAGGPAVTLACVAGAAAVAFRAPPAHPVAHALVLAFLGVSLLYALLSLAPFRVGGVGTDGRGLLDLRPGGPLAGRSAAALSLAGLACDGVRPRDYPPALAAAAGTAPADAAPADRALAHWTAYGSALDRGDWGAARGALDAALRLRHFVAPVLRGGLLLDGAYLAARVDRDAPTARALLAEADAAGRHAFSEPTDRHLAVAAIAWAAGEAGAARAALVEARTAVARVANRGAAAASAALIEDLAGLVAAAYDPARAA